MMDTVWDERNNVTLPLLALDQAMARVRELGDGPKPIVLAEFQR